MPLNYNICVNWQKAHLFLQIKEEHPDVQNNSKVPVYHGKAFEH